MAYFLIFLAHVLGWVAGVAVLLLLLSTTDISFASSPIPLLLFGIGTPALVAAQLTNTYRVFVSYTGFALLLQGGIWTLFTALMGGAVIFQLPIPPLVDDLIRILGIFWFGIHPLLTYFLASRSRRVAMPLIIRD